MTCTGCEYAGMFPLSPFDSENILYATGVGANFDHLNPKQMDDVFNVMRRGPEGYTVSLGIPNTFPGSMTHQPTAFSASNAHLFTPESEYNNFLQTYGAGNGTQGTLPWNNGGSLARRQYAGWAAGLKEYSQDEKFIMTPDEIEETHPPSYQGWRMTPDIDPTGDNPTEIYIVPLQFGHNPANGSCSTATSPECAGGTPCSAKWYYTFEFHKVRPGSSANTKVGGPSFGDLSVTYSDPLGALSNATVTAAGSPKSYFSESDPLGRLSGSIVGTFQTFTFEGDINPDDCGEWGVFRTSWRDWIMAIPGYTVQTQREVSPGVSEDDPSHVPGGAWAIGVKCNPCKPVMSGPITGGGQGGGKNQNPNSIGN